MVLLQVIRRAVLGGGWERGTHLSRTSLASEAQVGLSGGLRTNRSRAYLTLLMVLKSFLFAVLLNQDLWGAACCLSGSPKTFVALQRFEKYQLGLSFVARDTYGRFNNYGELEKTIPRSTLGMSVGAGVRLTPDLQLAATVPFLREALGSGTESKQRTSLGDSVIEARWTLWESVYRTDWWPTLMVHGGVKLPTGVKESTVEGRFLPGTGNGIWEPFGGVGLTEALGPVLLGVRLTYTGRVPTGDFKEGDAFESVETVSIAPSSRLLIVLGATQTWTAVASRGNIHIPDSDTRVATLFVSSSYWVTRQWIVTASADFGLPLERWGGRNHSAERSIGLTSRYSFF